MSKFNDNYICDDASGLIVNTNGGELTGGCQSEIYINSKIRLTSIMMSQKNRNNNWLDYNGATHDHHCPDDYWKVIRKVFYSTNVML